MEMFTDKLVADKCLKLLMDIYIGLNDPVSMSILPLYATIETKAR